MLQQRDEGGEQWLYSLRELALEDAVISLCSLPGIGPKVAACIALFSLDQHHAIPVDTHVWQVCLFQMRFFHALWFNLSACSFFQYPIRIWW